jgi:hypothetical protein
MNLPGGNDHFTHTNRRDTVEVESQATSFHKLLGHSGDGFEQPRSGVEVPMRRSDMPMAQVGGKGHHMPCDPEGVQRALLQRPHSEAMTEVMDPRAALARSTPQADAPGQTEKGGDHGLVGQCCALSRNKEMVIQSAPGFSPRKISIKPGLGG